MTRASLSHGRDVVVVLDRSGSMEPLRQFVVNGFNELLGELGADDRVTLVQFDTVDPFELVIDAQPAGIARRLTFDDFEPRGGTPLYDAVTDTITYVVGRRGRDAVLSRAGGAVTLAIISDGEENSSTRYTGRDLQRLLQYEIEADGWDVRYVGLGNDAFQEADRMGLDAGTVSSLTADERGTTAAFLSIVERLSDPE
jgi:Mg-chelatase subunit ChlD